MNNIDPKSLLQENCLKLKDGFEVKGLKFQNSTSYSQSDKLRVPTSFTAKTPGLQITITCGHLAYKPQWVFHCYKAGFDTFPLGNIDSPEEAARIALLRIEEVLRQYLLQINVKLYE